MIFKKHNGNTEQDKSHFQFLTLKDLPEEVRKQADSARCENNRFFLRIGASLSLFMSLIMIFRRLFINERIVCPMPRQYMGTFIAMAVLSVFFLVVSYFFAHRIKQNLCFAIQIFFVLALVICYAFLAAWDLQISRDFSAIIGSVLFLSITMWIKPITYCLVVFVSDVIVIGAYLLGNRLFVSPVEISAKLIVFFLAGLISLYATSSIRNRGVLTEWKLAESIRELKELSTKDSLTKLLNRRMMLEDFNGFISRFKRSGIRFSMIMIDIDHFKKVNDTLGHSIGDSVLTEGANLMCSAIRDSDRVYRIGGEEFVVILADCDIIGAEKLAERLGQNFKASSFSGVPWNITISMGIAECTECGKPEDMLKLADTRLYQAKNSGRDKFISKGFHDFLDTLEISD